MKSLLLLFIFLFLTSCAGITSDPQSTPIGVMLDLKVKAYFEKCDSLDHYRIDKKKNMFVGKAECIILLEVPPHDSKKQKVYPVLQKKKHNCF